MTQRQRLTEYWNDMLDYYVELLSEYECYFIDGAFGEVEYMPKTDEDVEVYMNIKNKIRFIENELENLRGD